MAIDRTPKFNDETMEGWQNEIQTGLETEVPHLSVQKTTLGGPNRGSLIISLSLDPKETWANKIYENSRHMRFHLDYTGCLEQFQKYYKIEKKFRKSRVKTANDVVKKVRKYLDEVKKEKKLCF
jgi:hypothetical protein